MVRFRTEVWLGGGTWDGKKLLFPSILWDNLKFRLPRIRIIQLLLFLLHPPSLLPFIATTDSGVLYYKHRVT